MKADHKEVTRLLNIASGQINGIVKMVEEDKYCIDISNQLLAVISMLKKIDQMVIKAHLEGCLKEAITSGEDVNLKLEEIMKTIIKMNN